MTCKAALFASLLAACSAVASTSAAQSTDRRAEARARAREGLALDAQGDDAGALLKFQQAYALVPMPELLFDVAVAEQRVGRLLEAQAAYRKCLADPTFSAHAAEARQHLGELEAQLGHLKIDAPPGTVLAIDGQSVADWSVPVDVMPGTHAIDASNGWHVTRSVNAPAGQQVSLVLGPPAESAPTGAAVASPAPLPATPLETPAEERPTFWNIRREMGLGVAAVGLVTLGAGIYFDAQASSKQSQASSLSGLSDSACSATSPPPQCASLRDARSAQHTDAVASDVLLTVGALGTLAGAALFLWPGGSRSSARSHAALLPMVLPQGGGLQLRGEM